MKILQHSNSTLKSLKTFYTLGADKLFFVTSNPEDQAEEALKAWLDCLHLWNQAFSFSDNNENHVFEF